MKTDDLDLLSENGLKNTKPRVSILNILALSLTPVTAEEIYQKSPEFDKTINLSTVYRTLEVFVEKGIVTKSYLYDDNKAYYQINNHEHKHFLICDECKAIIEIDGCPFQEFEKEVEQETDFTITHHNLQLFGICPKCRGKQKKEPL